MTQDLSTSFGEPAASRLRGLLPPRAQSTASPNGQTPDEPEPVDSPPADSPPVESAVRDEEAEEPTRSPRRRAAAGTRAAGTRAAGTRAAGTRAADTKAADTKANAPHPRASTTNRRWGVARVASREHVDLLVLCALREGPASAHGIIERVRTDSGGALEAPERTVHTTLHRLTRNRLLRRIRPAATPGPHYGLTPAGERAARSRARQWRLFARAVDGVIGEPDPR